MKTFFIFVLLCLNIGAFANAQTWMALNQLPLRLNYELPYNWYVGGYMTGRSCNCTGGTINTAPKRDLNMVIFYSNNYSLDSLKEQDVWGYHFYTPSNTQELATKHFIFELVYSRWEKDDGALVLRLSTEYQGHAYVVYFWGTELIISNMKQTILHIINSMQLI